MSGPNEDFHPARKIFRGGWALFRSEIQHALNLLTRRHWHARTAKDTQAPLTCLLRN
jgi:hypothetical protein